MHFKAHQKESAQIVVLTRLRKSFLLFYFDAVRNAVDDPMEKLISLGCAYPNEISSLIGSLAAFRTALKKKCLNRIKKPTVHSLKGRQSGWRISMQKHPHLNGTQNVDNVLTYYRHYRFYVYIQIFMGSKGIRQYIILDKRWHDHATFLLYFFTYISSSHKSYINVSAVMSIFVFCAKCACDAFWWILPLY